MPQAAEVFKILPNELQFLVVGFALAAGLWWLWSKSNTKANDRPMTELTFEQAVLQAVTALREDLGHNLGQNREILSELGKCRGSINEIKIDVTQIRDVQNEIRGKL